MLRSTSGRWRASSALALTSCASAPATAASVLRTSGPAPRDRSRRARRPGLTIEPTLTGARHHAAEDAEAVVGRCSAAGCCRRTGRASPGATRLDRQHRPNRRRASASGLHRASASSASSAKQGERAGDHGLPPRRSRPSGPAAESPPAETIFWPELKAGDRDGVAGQAIDLTGLSDTVIAGSTSQTAGLPACSNSAPQGSRNTCAPWPAPCR